LTKVGVRQRSLHRRCVIELQIVVTRISGRFHATIPCLNVFDTGKNLNAALTGAIAGAIGKLELADERKQFDSYLERTGFRKKGNTYCGAQAAIEARRKEHMDSTAWDADDPDRGHFMVIDVKLARLELQVDFNGRENIPIWEPEYALETEASTQATG
jgi:hypothetical protein